MTDSPARPQPQKRFFRSASSAPQISKEAAFREGDIIRFAVSKLGTDDAMSFLNEMNVEMSGRPLQVAAAKEDGAVIVRDAVLARAAKAASGVDSVAIS